MKPTREKLAVETTLEGENIKMGFHQGSEAELQSIFIDMYNDTQMAPLREIATNAWDAHVEAGVKRAIEISLGTQLSPMVKIRDYGIGLDAEKIRTIYSQYGASTKRESDDYNGQLGIGCKSPLTYSDQFTVIGWAHGVRTTVVVSRNADGSGNMKVVDERPCDPDEQGAEVSWPVKRDNEFADKAKELFRFWPKGSVLVNGKEPDTIREDDEDAYKLSDRLWIVEGEKQDWIVQGNVPYPAELGVWDSVQTGSSRRMYGYDNTRKAIVAFVEIGEVDFTPAREALQMTALTNQTIEKLKDEFNKAAGQAIERDVQSAKSRREAFEKYWDAVEAIDLPHSPPEAEWQGEPIPKHVEYPRSSDPDKPTLDDAYMWVVNGQLSNWRGGLSDYREMSRLRSDDLKGITVWVTGFFPTKFSADQRRRLEAYREWKKLDQPSRFILLKRDELPSPDWVDQTNIWDWADVRTWRDPSAPTSGTNGKKIRGSYYARTSDDIYGKEWQADELPSKNLFWRHGSKYQGMGEIERLSKLTDRKCTIVMLSANRIDKFKRDFPHAVHYDEAVTAFEFAKFAEKSEEWQKLYYWPGLGHFGLWRALSALSSGDIAKLDDPALATAINYQRKKNQQKRLPNDNILPEKLSARLDVITGEEMTNRYPLLKALTAGYSGNGGSEHLILYLNAAYAARQKENT